MRLDVAKMTPQPVEGWKEPPPIRPHVIPPDDPAWVAKLKALPATQIMRPDFNRVKWE